MKAAIFFGSLIATKWAMITTRYRADLLMPVLAA